MMPPEPNNPDRSADDFFEAMCDQIIATPMPSRRRLIPSRPHWRPRRSSGFTWRLPVLSGGMAAAAATIALLLTLGAGGGSAPPAFAVTVNPNHTVTIVLRNLSGGIVRQLNKRLAALHAPARMVPIVHGCSAPVHAVVGGYEGQPYRVAPGPAKTLEVDYIAWHSTHTYSPYIKYTMSLDSAPGRTRIFAVTRAGELGWHLPKALAHGDLLRGFINHHGWFIPEVVGQAPRCVGDSGLIDHRP